MNFNETKSCFKDMQKEETNTFCS